MSTILEQKCPCCGGAVEFNAGIQKLKCPYCDTEFDINDIPEKEDSNGFSRNPKSSQWSEAETAGISEYICNSCGGEIVTDSTTGATTCPYCGNQVVMKGQFSGTLRPDMVIPFKLDKKQAKEALKKHISSKKFVPKSFLSDNRLEEIRGIYVPYWLFTCDAAGDGDYNARKIRRWSDSNYNYTETSYYSAHRNGNISFDSIPVDGSKKMPDDLMESVEPFDISQAVDFNTAYLAGYLADKYDVTAEESMPRANERVKQSLDDALKETVTGYDFVETNNINMSITNGFYKYALYPVWILNTTWNGEKYTFAMNGQTGKFVGNIPIDKKAVTIASLLLGTGLSVAAYALMTLMGLL